MDPVTDQAYWAGEQHVLETRYVELDPVLDGFEGVVAELVYLELAGDSVCQGGHGILHKESYVLTLSAAVTGNTLLRFTSASEQRARWLLGRLLRSSPAELVTSVAERAQPEI